MKRIDVIPSIVFSAHALARIAAQEAGNDAPAAQWRLLSLLEEHEPLRIGELARAARTTQPGMTRLIGDLERSGLVIRRADPSDSRATLVALTARGLDALRDWRLQFRDTIAPHFADLDDSDWRALETAAGILAARARPRQAARGKGVLA